MISKQILLTYLYLLIYICLSSGVILYNKWVLSPKYFKFPFPITLTMIHMGFSALVAVILVRVLKTIEELKNKLWATICELEDLKNNSREELRKKEDNINQLIHLVKAANLERDEARDQLQMLLNKLTLPNPVELFSVAPLQALGSSSLTGSDNLTDAPNNHSHDSSPTVIDESISPDLSIVNFADSSNALISQQHALNVCAPSTEDNMMKLIFEQLAKKPLPEKGRLLEAVIGAGPILETLFVAGSLPRWRNPPPLKPFLVPPLSIGGDHAALNQSCLILNSKRQKSQ